jgi:uncharacterized membrane protein (DUF485 family)
VIDESLARLSDTFFTVTVVVYSLAVVAFCAELAFGRPVPARELVVAGSRADALPAAPEPAAEPARVQRLGAVGMLLTVAGLLTHAAVVVTRGLAAGRLPWGNMYEFTTVVVLVAVVAYTVLALRAPVLRHIGVFIMGPVVVSMALIRMVLYVQAGPLVASLRSWWLGVHVTTATLGFGIFFLSGIVSVLYLVRSRREEQAAAGAVLAPPTGPRSSASRSGPSRSSPAPSGRRAPGAGSGAGTRRRPGRSSPGWSTRPTCTPGPPPAGGAARRRGSTSWGSR